jgi:hypothetical protein
MNKLYIISYSGTNAIAVKEAIKLLGSWFSHFENQYLLGTMLPINVIKETLDKKITQGVDRLLILEVELKDVKGWINKNGWDWITNQKTLLKQ